MVEVFYEEGATSYGGWSIIGFDDGWVSFSPSSPQFDGELLMHEDELLTLRNTITECLEAIVSSRSDAA